MKKVNQTIFELFSIMSSGDAHKNIICLCMYIHKNL